METIVGSYGRHNSVLNTTRVSLIPGIVLGINDHAENNRNIIVLVLTWKVINFLMKQKKFFI